MMIEGALCVQMKCVNYLECVHCVEIPMYIQITMSAFQCINQSSTKRAMFRLSSCRLSHTSSLFIIHSLLFMCVCVWFIFLFYSILYTFLIGNNEMEILFLNGTICLNSRDSSLSIQICFFLLLFFFF